MGTNNNQDIARASARLGRAMTTKAPAILGIAGTAKLVHTNRGIELRSTKPCPVSTEIMVRGHDPHSRRQEAGYTLAAIPQAVSTLAMTRVWAKAGTTAPPPELLRASLLARAYIILNGGRQEAVDALWRGWKADAGRRSDDGLTGSWGSAGAGGDLIAGLGVGPCSYLLNLGQDSMYGSCRAFALNIRIWADDSIALVDKSDVLEVRVNPVHLPDCVLTAAKGRPLADVVDHPMIHALTQAARQMGDEHDLTVVRIEQKVKSTRFHVSKKGTGGGHHYGKAATPAPGESRDYDEEMQRLQPAMEQLVELVTDAFGGTWSGETHVISRDGAPQWDEREGAYHETERERRLAIIRETLPEWNPPPLPAGMPVVTRQMREDHAQYRDFRCTGAGVDVNAATINAWRDDARAAGMRPGLIGELGLVTKQRYVSKAIIAGAIGRALVGNDPGATKGARTLLRRHRQIIASPAEVAVLRAEYGGLDIAVLLMLVIAAAGTGGKPRPVVLAPGHAAGNVHTLTLVTLDDGTRRIDLATAHRWSSCPGNDYSTRLFPSAQPAREDHEPIGNLRDSGLEPIRPKNEDHGYSRWS